MEFESYSLVLLRSGPRAAEYAGEELERLQAAHLAHLEAMRESGAMLVAGPFGEQADETLRGLCIYRTDLEETRRLAEADPSVQGGRLQAEVMEWWTRRGAVSFPPLSSG